MGHVHLEVAYVHFDKWCYSWIEAYSRRCMVNRQCYHTLPPNSSSRADFQGCNTTVVQTFAKVAHQVGFAYCYSIMELNASAARTASSHSLSGLNRPGSTPGIARQSSIASLSSAASGSGSGSGFPFNARSTGGTAGITPLSAGGSYGHIHQNQSLPREARKVNIESGLDSYYPFDPFDLPRTGEAIESLYWTYGDVAVDASDDEDDDEEEDESEDDEDDDEGEEERVGALSTSARKRMGVPAITTYGSKGHGHGGTSLDRRRAVRDGGVLSTSFEGMSISPARAGLMGRA